MHRVELKAPEYFLLTTSSKSEFLMHRVELKGSCVSHKDKDRVKFLMHRVELKGGRREVSCSVDRGS